VKRQEEDEEVERPHAGTGAEKEEGGSQWTIENGQWTVKWKREEGNEAIDSGRLKMDSEKEEALRS